MRPRPRRRSWSSSRAHSTHASSNERRETSGFRPDPPFPYFATRRTRARAEPTLASIPVADATRKGGWPMSMDFGKLAEQAQKMQEELKRIQEDAADELVTASAGG